ncbi:MAG: DUF2971 domain-containing protein [Bacteroidetes bacterium]|nr:DUF2971 domain-containing protein [Bacteroidota bacterium]
MSKENDEWTAPFAKVDKFRREVLNVIFPYAVFSQAGMNGSSEANSFNGKLLLNDLFKNTEYEYKHKGNGRFIHFTSLFALKSILDNGWLRMSEFGNLTDKNELFYGAKVFEDSQVKKLKELKNNIFCLSACEANANTQRDSFMWEAYGDKGRGVFIEYEFTDKKPYFHIFGKVQYGLEALEPLRQLKILSEKFKMENNGFFPEDFLSLILEIQAFHKAKRYSCENEVRVLFRKDKSEHEPHNDSTIYQDFNSNQEVKYFSKIYLNGRHDLITEDNLKRGTKEDIINCYPQIQISRVVLGYNLSVENKVEINQFIHEIKRIHKNIYDFDVYQITEELEIVKMI